MAAAFDRAGFEAVDVHMSDLLSGPATCADFRGLAACGGFSYGDVLGAGEGWAKSILFNARARAMFSEFFARADTFSLGVCNGCQMLSKLKELIPGAASWPRFVRNRSERFEARVCWSRSCQPVDLARRDERFASSHRRRARRRAGRIGIRRCRAALEHKDLWPRASSITTATDSHYPENPNGSPAGITASRPRRPRHAAHAPPGAGLPRRSDSWRPRAWAKMGLDADIPQRAGLGGLTSTWPAAMRLAPLPRTRPPRRRRKPNRRRLGAGFGATIGRALAPLRRQSQVHGVALAVRIARIGPQPALSPTPTAMTVAGPTSAMGTARTYDLPRSGNPLSSAEPAHLRA